MSARVAYDKELADRIRELIGTEADLVEKPMFGGLAFLVGGNMAVAAGAEGGIMVRVDPAEAQTLTASLGVRSVGMRGRPMRGWVRVAPEGLCSERALAAWVDRGVAYARSLPRKRHDGLTPATYPPARIPSGERPKHPASTSATRTRAPRCGPTPTS